VARIDPVGPRTEGPDWVLPVAGVQRIERRREEDERRREREPRRRSPPPPAPGRPDADGHIDVEA